MIVSLNTWFSDIVFTSTFPDLELVSDQGWEQLELWAEEQLIFSVNLYVNENGHIYWTNLGQVMEQYMIENQLSFASFSLRDLTVVGAENRFRRDFVAVFSSYFMDGYAESFIEENFLTTLSAKQISTSAYDMVPFISKKGEDITDRHHVVFYADGVLEAMDWENAKIEEKDIALHNINVSAKDYVSEIQGSYPGKEIKLLSFSVSVGPRNITYYVTDRKNLTQMFFINAFNAFELFEVQGVTTTKTKVERDTAVVNHREVFYDRTIEKSYEVQTSALSSPIKDWVEQFLFSPLVKMFDPNADSIDEMAEILITESTCEISNSNTELSKVKFTWKYADVYPRIDSIKRKTEGSFSQQFEFQFK